MLLSLLILVPCLLAQPATARKITIKNSCAYVIWPGVYAKPGPAPEHASGWRLDSGATEVLDVSDNWQSGRIWARTGCTQQDGLFSCLTGNCGNGPQGAGKGGDMSCVLTDIPPASLAEFTLSASGSDHYDISLVDGFNLPMSIIPSKNKCKAPKCEANINEICPPLLRTGVDDTGVNLGCLHPCNAGFGIEKWGSRSCCSFGYNDPTLCAICGVDYYNVFKDGCPEAYAYAYDEKSGTALWTCDSAPGNMSDYTVEFCPNSGSFIGSKEPSMKYANATATCSNQATTYLPPPGAQWTPGSAVPSPSTTIGKGTLRIVATNLPNVGGQAAIANITGTSGTIPTGVSFAPTDPPPGAPNGTPGTPQPGPPAPTTPATPNSVSSATSGSPTVPIVSSDSGSPPPSPATPPPAGSPSSDSAFPSAPLSTPSLLPAEPTSDCEDVVAGDDQIASPATSPGVNEITVTTIITQTVTATVPGGASSSLHDTPSDNIISSLNDNEDSATLLPTAGPMRRFHKKARRAF